MARVERIVVDREAEDAAGVFGGRIAALAADAVVDMICFTPASAQQLVDALRPTRPLLVHCGTIWVHGPVARVPVTEDEPRTAYGDYGTGKAAIEALLHRETLAGGVPSVVLHPGHISGPWPVITPAGNLDLGVWRRLAIGEPLALPDLGLGVLHHVHADDVAQAFERAIVRPAAIGSSFHVVSEQAMTLRGLAAGVAGWFGREPALEFVDWSEFERRVGAEHAETVVTTSSAASPRASIEPATCSATGPGTAHSTLSTNHFAGSRRTATSMSTTRTSERETVERQAVRMGASPAPPPLSDHNVSDPGVTLLQVVAYTLGAAVLVAASVALFSGRRRSGDTRRRPVGAPARPDTRQVEGGRSFAAESCARLARRSTAASSTSASFNDRRSEGHDDVVRRGWVIGPQKTAW